MSVLQAQGILLGLALGDALGAPTEFMRLDPDILRTYGMAGIQEPPTPALYTDDTQMTLALLQGVLEAGIDAPPEVMMPVVAQHFLAWGISPENNRAPGTTSMRAIANLRAGYDWRTSGIASSKGCGSAMRVAPLGYLYQHQPERLREVAHLSGLITHGHPAAVAASIGAAYAVKLALDGVPPETYLARMLAFTDGISEDYDRALLRVGHVLTLGSEAHAMRHIGEGWVGEEAVALALYCVLRYSDDYVRAVQRAANSDGDSDSIACIAGGIMGARLGLTAIPESWRARCENQELLMELGRQMKEARDGRR